VPRLLLPAVAVAMAVTLAGCSTGSSSSRPQPSRASGPSSAVPSDPASALLGGLDVCRLPTAAQVRSVTGLDAEATTRRLTPLPGYDAPVDVCGFGPSFLSSTFSVAVGLAPATPADVVRQRGRVVDVGAVGRVRQSAAAVTLTFLKGSTLVQLRADRVAGAPSPLGALTRAARQVADDVPADPPPDSRQASGRCAGVDPQAVAAVLGAPPAVSRSLGYQDRSAECSWAVRDRTLTVALYTNAQAGPFLADQKRSGPSTPVRGVPGDAFTTHDAAYVIAGDGQAAVVSGRLGKAAPGKPLAVTPALTRLLSDVSAALS
jgi:hypothetical protein